MRIGVAGKTGSGKTTVSALVAMAAAGAGRRVVAVDTDPSPNLAVSLGLDQDATDRIRVVPRALARGRGGGALTPEQVLSGYGVTAPSGVAVLHALVASPDPAGCGCPAHASDRSLLAEALDRFDLAVIDLEAGLDHLDRPGATLAHADALVVVVEPSRKSSLVAAGLVARARAAGAGRLAMVGTKARPGAEDAAFLAGVAGELGIDLVGVVAFSAEIEDCDRAGRGLVLEDGAPLRSARAVFDALGPAPPTTS